RAHGVPAELLRRGAGAVRQLPRPARAQDPAPADAGALRQRPGAGRMAAGARRGGGGDLSRPALAPAARTGAAADGRLRRHRLGAAQGRLRGREAIVRTHPAVHPGRVARRRGEPGQPSGGDDPRLDPRGHPRSAWHRPGAGAPERRRGGAGGPARRSGERIVVSQVLDGRTVAARNAGNPVAGRLWRELGQSLRNPEFWALSSWLDILVRTRRSYLGPLWLLVPSLVYVFGLGSFFASLHGRTMVEFAAYVALGAIVFRTL